MDFPELMADTLIAGAIVLTFGCCTAFAIRAVRWALRS